MDLLEQNRREESEGDQEEETWEEEGGKRTGGLEEEESASLEEGGGELLGFVGTHPCAVVDREERCARLTVKTANQLLLLPTFW